ncbi:MAG: hypothetical protein KA974_04490 [Saprospiraceae bacterium]|nr:hypothetical protein [Saprospiraceae bacterium]MBP7699752.1 hypothetical protein [Saprospiraceae bacterium]
MIPNIIHFIFGLAPDFGGKPFSLVHYIAIKSAYEINKPDKIFFVCKFIPDTIWFDKIRPYIEIVEVEPPTEIFGNPLLHYAHKADVIRLQRLLEFGGIYLDLDTICVKPLTPLLQNQFVMGVEELQNFSIFSKWRFNFYSFIRHPFKAKSFIRHGLCNAVMLAAPQTSFVQRWYESYNFFRSKGKDKFWNEHSVYIPAQFAQQYPNEITIVPPQYFFIPSYDERGLKDMFVNNTNFDESFVHHLWESKAWQYLSTLTIEDIRQQNSTYAKLANKIL